MTACLALAEPVCEQQRKPPRETKRWPQHARVRVARAHTRRVAAEAAALKPIVVARLRVSHHPCHHEVGDEPVATSDAFPRASKEGVFLDVPDVRKPLPTHHPCQKGRFG